MSYLIDNPNPRAKVRADGRYHGYPDRRGNPILAIVMHVTAGLEDIDGVDDTSAERTARYAATTDRPVSWHRGSDADSWLELLPDTHVAFHAKGVNSVTLGHEISKANVKWSGMPDEWVEATLRNAADAVRPWVRRHGIPVRRASASELRGARDHDGPPVGFVTHSDIDPSRRSDPGNDFPWPRFFELVRNGTPINEDDMPITEPTRVAKFQRILANSYPTRPDKGPPYAIKADGVVGPKTRAAIEDWQRRRGLTVTGELDTVTCMDLYQHVVLAKLDA